MLVKKGHQKHSLSFILETKDYLKFQVHLIILKHKLAQKQPIVLADST